MEDDVLKLLSQAHLPGQRGFSLDLASAGQTMGRFQLSDPYLYVLKWVQWAVLTCASRVWVEVLPDRVSVSHDGLQPETPSASELLSLEGGWGHFGSGFFAASRLAPASIALATRQGSHSLYGQGGLEIERGVTILKPRRKFSWNGILWEDLRLFLRPEAVLVRFHCSYAPVPIYLNGHWLNRPLFGVSCRTRGEQLEPVLSLAKWSKGLIRDDGPPRELLPIPDWDNAGNGEITDLPVWGRPCLAGRCMWYYLPIGPKASKHNEIIWIKDGVAVCKHSGLEDLPPGLHAVASCHGLTVDASQFELVRDAAYRRRVKEIKEAYEGKRLS
ncbi:MAG: hypothetical protein U0931_19825 [Vulcanimicrobiota bacterium]